MRTLFCQNFNTSHVSINHTGSIATTCVVRDFNTSHVSINLIHILPFWNAYRISIHLMFLLIAAAAPSDNTTTVISIHLMFLLIRYPIRSRWIRNIYFNTSHVSINHRPDRSRDDRRCTFQYISCFY